MTADDALALAILILIRQRKRYAAGRDALRSQAPDTGPPFRFALTAEREHIRYTQAIRILKTIKGDYHAKPKRKPIRQHR